MGEGGGKGVGSGWPQASKSGGGVAAGCGPQGVG